MTPYYSDDWLTVYQGDCRAVMASMEPESVHCVVTSPPYWGLRDYGTATWTGGDQDCDHRGEPFASSSSLAGYTSENVQIRTQRTPMGATCRRCGAQRVDAQLGLEPTPEAYVANMVAVFREVRRVLRDDGTVWLNLGSSYLSTSGMMYPQTEKAAHGHDRYKEWERPLPKRNRGDAGASGRSQSLQPERAPAYGSDGTGPRGSTGLGSAYPDLCDGCLAAQSSRTTDTLQPPLVSPLRDDTTTRDSEPVGSELEAVAAAFLSSQESTPLRSEPLPRAECSHCGNCGACLSVLRSPSRESQECVRRSAYNGGIGSRSEPSADRKSDTVSSGLAWGDYTSTLKPKDMVPIPWMVAMALQADGWYLRSDIIWSKPNPMPESVTDRPTKSHEYLFLLSKNARYFWDADAVRQPVSPHTLVAYPNGPGGGGGFRGDEVNDARTRGGFAKAAKEPVDTSGRNIRSVWTVATAPYAGSHFATFPPKLVEPCVKAGCPSQVCSECGAPWVRITGDAAVAPDLSQRTTAHYDTTERYGSGNGGNGGFDKLAAKMRAGVGRGTTGWRPTCAHDAPTRPGVVLDPFAGSGTTGMVAQALGRRAVLIDLNADYLVQAMQRNAQSPLGLGVA